MVKKPASSPPRRVHLLRAELKVVVLMGRNPPSQIVKRDCHCRAQRDSALGTTFPLTARTVVDDGAELIGIETDPHDSQNAVI